MLTVSQPLAEHLHDKNTTVALHRIRSEFLEMPGLRLTPPQAARLWASIFRRRSSFSTV